MIKNGLREKLSYIFVGSLSAILYWLIGVLLTTFTSLPIALASALAFGCSTIFGYVFQRKISFRSTNLHTDSAPKFAITSLVGLCIAAVVPLILSHFTSASDIIILLTVPAANAVPIYFLQKHWVFAPTR